MDHRLEKIGSEDFGENNQLDRFVTERVSSGEASSDRFSLAAMKYSKAKVDSIGHAKFHYKDCCTCRILQQPVLTTCEYSHNKLNLVVLIVSDNLLMKCRGIASMITLRRKRSGST